MLAMVLLPKGFVGVKDSSVCDLTHRGVGPVGLFTWSAVALCVCMSKIELTHQVVGFRLPLKSFSKRVSIV